jgi:phage gp37-like protein
VTLVSVRNAIAAKIKMLIPTLATCEGHGGAFTVAEVSRLGKNAPAVLVVALGISESSAQGGMPVATMRLAAFVLAKDVAVDKAKRGDIALSIVDQLVATLNTPVDNRFGLDGVQGAIKTRAENQYSGDLDQQGLALWVVTWTHQVDLDFAGAQVELGNFTTLDVTLKQGDETASEDIVSLPSPS